MQFFAVVFTLWALAASISASPFLQARQSFPDCAVNCLVDANLEGCSPIDNVCLCNNEAFVNSTTICIQSNCTGSDLTTAEAFAEAICASVGVYLGS